MRRRSLLRSSIFLAVVFSGACGDSVQPPTEDPAVEPFVGRWEADVFRVVSVADTTIDFDLFDDVDDGSFSITVEPSGTYTATLAFGGRAIPQIGTLTATDAAITLRPNGGAPASGPYAFESADVLTVGPSSTEFDFNIDGEAEPGLLTFRVRRQ